MKKSLLLCAFGCLFALSSWAVVPNYINKKIMRASAYSPPFGKLYAGEQYLAETTENARAALRLTVNRFVQRMEDVAELTIAFVDDCERSYSTYEEDSGYRYWTIKCFAELSYKVLRTEPL